MISSFFATFATINRSADDSPRFERNAVKIFSLASARFVHTLRFPAAVHALHASATALVVSMRAALHVLDPHSLAHRWAAATAPQPDLHAAVALGSRWVAHCAPAPPNAAPADSGMWSCEAVIAHTKITSVQIMTHFIFYDSSDKLICSIFSDALTKYQEKCENMV